MCVRRNGLAKVSLKNSMKAGMRRLRSSLDERLPRLGRRRASVPNQISTWFSQEQCLGVWTRRIRWPAILQEGRPRAHVPQNPGPAFHARIFFYPAEAGDQPDQAGRLVGVELVDDEDPLRPGVGGHGGADMAGEIVPGAGVPHRGAGDPARRRLEVGDQCLRAVADVFELLGFRLAG